MFKTANKKRSFQRHVITYNYFFLNAGNHLSKFLNFKILHRSMPRTLLGWSTLSGRLSEPPFTKSWIYPSCVSACWHVCLTTCVPVCTSECLHVCVWMTACLHICIFAHLSLYLHVCISWCVHFCECMTGKHNPLWVGATDGGLTCCTTLLADLWSCCPHIKVLLFLITIWLKLDMNLRQNTENYHLQEKLK